MLQYYFQIIFLLCVTIVVNYGISRQHSAGEMASSSEPRGNCSVQYCKCSEIPQWDGGYCKDDRLTRFPKLYFNSSKYLPGRMFRGLRILSITLKDSDITAAENIFEGIIRLDEFEVVRSSIEVVPDFRFVNNWIETINIASSSLSSLQGKHLQNLTRARDLLFSNNYIQYIDPDVFKGTENVWFLNLDYNLLTYIPPKLLESMKRLYRFSAIHNNLLNVDELFSVRGPRNIHLAFNNITNFYLTDLYNVEKEQRPLLMPPHIMELDMSNNFINETSLAISTCNSTDGSTLNIFTLNLNGNLLLNLNNCLRCLHLTTLQIIGNQIQFLGEKDFINFIFADKVQLHENRIRRIDTDTFKPLNTSLRQLDLSFNEITTVNGSIQYLSKLLLLNLSHNSIQTFAENEFAGAHSLFKLYLQHNQIKSLGAALQGLEKLQILNITDNAIQLIKPDQIPDSLKYIYLADNVFKCDRDLKPFLKLLNPSEGGFEIDTPVFLQPERETILLKQRNCPHKCSCGCSEYEDVFYRSVDCSSRNLSSIPQFLDGNLTLLGEPFIGIRFENNNLEFLDAANLPTNLVQLYLSNNSLKRLPESIIDNQPNLKQVSLSNNPWNCDCRALKFKKWLTSNNHIIKDIHGVRCGISDSGGRNLSGSVIWKLNDIDLCPVKDLVFILSVSLGALSFVAFCLFARVLYTKYEMNIKVFLYSRGFTFVKEKVLDEDKAFDAFISFSHKDDEFVITEIVSEIETRDPNICLCLHYRHFRPGELITDNITYAVQKSKRTVLILSRNFLESDWCLLEFKTALIESLQDKMHRVIVVKFGDLPEEIDPTIKVFLDSTTYMTWGETNFWNKLLYTLPSRSSVQYPVLRFVGDTESYV